jgi:hypothetical protein
MLDGMLTRRVALGRSARPLEPYPLALSGAAAYEDDGFAVAELGAGR